MLELFPERGGDPERAGKRDPLDPLLWRGAREGEPSWPAATLGPGRPGWHIECAVIALNLLGDRLDVQGGGNDLVFPHHECSAAHAERLTGTAPFARALRPRRHDRPGRREDVEVQGQPGLRLPAARRPGRSDGRPAGLMAGHYRADRAVDRRRAHAAQQRLDRWRRAAAAPSGPSGAALLAGVRERLGDDLDTPGALALADDWADAALAGTGDDPQAPALFAGTVDALLGIRL